MVSPKRASRHAVVPAILRVIGAWADSRSKGGTKVGAAVYHVPSGGMFLGYNGFPPGVEDREEWWSNKDRRRVTKHDLVVHAETNAILKAVSSVGIPATDCLLVCTLLPCSHCMRLVATVGIKNVYYESDSADLLTARERMVIGVIAGQAGITVQRMDQ